MKKFIYILLVLFIVPSTNKAQTTSSKAAYNPNYRNVYWIHGVGGDVNSLKTLSDYFRSTYKINSYHTSYASNRGIKEAAYQVRSLSIGLQKDDDIVIAHSMGGLVSRQYFKDNPSRRFGGIMTLNTPHTGAAFANSFDDGKIQAFFKKVGSEGLAGYNVMSPHVGDPRRGFHDNTLTEMGILEDLIETRDLLSKIGIIVTNIFGPNPMAGHTLEWLLNLGTSSLASKLPDAVDNQVKTLVTFAAAQVFGYKDEGWENSKDDLKTGSPIVKSLNNSPINCPRIAITGTANSPAGMRFIGSTLSAMDKDNLSIGKIDDGAFLRYTNAIIKDARKCKDEYAKLYRRGSWWSFGLSNSYFSKRRDAFDRQARFWENGFEREYQKCLGSIYYTTQTQTYTVWENICNNGPAELARMPIIDDDEDCMRLVRKTRTIRVQRMHPTDGIVVLPSQQGMAGATKYNIPGNDHEKAKRSWGTVNYINSKFKNSNSYFYCESK